ncbi:helix-hairpin-helix domain-containing protein [Psychrobacillus vulpis]|uniref:Competence protein ComEA n=1 Tax=Psychrobacillus vulpis TaxID=2325572 RepID=A0A544TP88_9BACI|nr:helix-hairpin-helix domain-containing protein [Psychrobacillus vulpis]TQR19260.1 competence protein ComEA [Psychrobacillus vulpis]
MIFLFLTFMQKYKKKLLLPTTVVILIVISLIYFQFNSANPTADSIQPIPLNEPFIFEDETTTEYSENNPIFVEVKGAVNKPGVYELSSGDRVLKAIDLAGGYLTESDSTSINHAQKVEDEMVIYVPIQGEEVEQLQISHGENSNLININKADAALLSTLPGIGPAKAEAILSYRNENGKFQETGDLMKVTGIGQKTYEKLESLITVK